MRDQGLDGRELIARGNTSDIYAWTETTVAKVLRPEIPRHWASVEADITRRVRSAGIPVPATDGVVEVDGRPALILERVSGPTMWSRMKAEPEQMPHLCAVLVGLQADLHATTVRGLPDLARRLGSKIDEAVQVSAGERQEAQALLASMAQDGALCHGDIHPANIVMSRSGPVILDWYDAASGSAMADRARSSLLMRPLEHEPSGPAHLEGATSDFLDRLHALYLATLVGRGLLDLPLFARWEAIEAVGRMSEPVPSDDLLVTWRRWRDEGVAATERMVAVCLAKVRSSVEAAVSVPGDALRAGDAAAT